MIRYIIAEQANAVALGRFTTGATVTISVYNKGTGAGETLTSEACTEIGTTGVFKWAWSNLTTPPTLFTEYLFIMADGVSQQMEEVAFGGYPDTLVSSVISSPSGGSIVTITVKDQDTNPIGAVKVAIYDDTNTVIQGSGTTDASGIFAFTIDNGSYKVRLTKLQTNFSLTEDLTVSGTTAVEYSGEVLTVPVPVQSGICRVAAFAYNQAGQSPAQEFDGTAKIESLPYNFDGKYHLGDRIDATYDTLTGEFYWLLPHGSTVQFRADSMGISMAKVIPAQANANLQDLT